MPDTGAPWNIPYVAGTDLVSDWPTDSQDLAEAIADGLDDAANAGIGSNVVSTTKTDLFSTTSTSFTAVTGLTATITPTSNTAKVLVVVSLSYGQSAAASNASFNLVRASTNLSQSTGFSNNQTLTMSNIPTNGEFTVFSGSIVFLDSPATTAATAYSVEMKVDSGTGTVNGRGSSSSVWGATSSITVIEVAV